MYAREARKATEIAQKRIEDNLEKKKDEYVLKIIKLIEKASDDGYYQRTFKAPLKYRTVVNEVYDHFVDLLGYTWVETTDDLRNEIVITISW